MIVKVLNFICQSNCKLDEMASDISMAWPKSVEQVSCSIKNWTKWMHICAGGVLTIIYQNTKINPYLMMLSVWIVKIIQIQNHRLNKL